MNTSKDLLQEFRLWGAAAEFTASHTLVNLPPLERIQTIGALITLGAQLDADGATLELAKRLKTAYEVAAEEFGATLLDGGPWMQFKNPKTGKNVVVKDAIADAMLQQILLRPAEYDVIATLNLNGDYLSDALAAEVGGIGIAPGANLSDTVAMFEATHGTAPKYAGKDQVNPGSLILSAEMMLRHMGWVEAADLIIKGTNGAISAKTVTYDFERLMDGATLVSSSGFGDALIKHM